MQVRACGWCYPGSNSYHSGHGLLSPNGLNNKKGQTGGSGKVQYLAQSTLDDASTLDDDDEYAGALRHCHRHSAPPTAPSAPSFRDASCQTTAEQDKQTVARSGTGHKLLSLGWGLVQLLVWVVCGLFSLLWWVGRMAVKAF